MKYFLFILKFLFLFLFYNLIYIWISYLVVGILPVKVYLIVFPLLLLLFVICAPFLLLDIVKASSLDSRAVKDCINASTLRSGMSDINIFTSKKFVKMVFFIPQLFGQNNIVIGANLVTPPSNASMQLIDNLFTKHNNLKNLSRLLPVYFGLPFLYIYKTVDRIEAHLLTQKASHFYTGTILSVLLVLKFVFRPLLGFHAMKLGEETGYSRPQIQNLIDDMLDELKGFSSHNEILKIIMPFQK